MMLARDHQITTTHQRHFRRVCRHKAPTILQADGGHALAGWQYRGMAIFINILLVLLALALIGLAIWGIVRYRYVKSLKALSWEFDSNPPIDVANGLNVPPFGIGFGRSVDDAIHGASRDQATPFVAFKYRCTNWRSAGYVVRMPLPAPYLPGEVTGPACSADLPLAPAPVQYGAATATAPDPRVAQAYGAALAPQLQGPWRLSIDHQDLVLIDAPKKAEELAAVVEVMAQARGALLALPHEQFAGPPPPPGLSVYGHDDWTYLPRDDSYLQQIGHTTGGSNHKAKDIIYGTAANISFLRLTHTWETTYTTTDGQGNTQTHTEHHEEMLCEFRPGFPFMDLSANWGFFGKKQKFEWEEFNRQFKIRSANPRFASDVIHQRQMEYLMASGPVSFNISEGRILIGGDNDWWPQNIEAVLSFLVGFFGRVPDFVWQNLGAWPRPVPEVR